MILNTYYKSEDGQKVYLEGIDASSAFYKIGSHLVHSTIEFFASKYKLEY